VRNAVAVTLGADMASRRLAAFVTGNPEQSVDPAALMAHLGMRLPGFMVPSAIHRVDAFPRLPNGKIDRGRLAAEAVRLPAVGTRRQRRPSVRSSSNSLQFYPAC